VITGTQDNCSASLWREMVFSIAFAKFNPGQEFISKERHFSAPKYPQIFFEGDSLRLAYRS